MVVIPAKNSKMLRIKLVCDRPTDIVTYKAAIAAKMYEEDSNQVLFRFHI